MISTALLVVAAAAGIGLLLYAGEKSPDAMVEAELAGKRFSYARAYARDEATGVGGPSERLSFIVSFPAFVPVERKGSGETLSLVVTPKDEEIDPAERPIKLYARFLTPETFEGPGGLVLRRFEEGSPYDSEALFVAPPDGRTFFARCPKPDTGAPGETCISVFRDGVMDVELRYSPALLEHWETLQDGARTLLAKMTARKRR